jgi:hypothetical protein
MFVCRNNWALLFNCAFYFRLILCSRWCFEKTSQSLFHLMRMWRRSFPNLLPTYMWAILVVLSVLCSVSGNEQCEPVTCKQR